MTLTLPDLPSELDAALRRRAAEQHRAVELVAVDALKAGLGLTTAESSGGGKTDLAASVRARFDPLGGIELAEDVREPMREPLDLGE